MLPCGTPERTGRVHGGVHIVNFGVVLQFDLTVQDCLL